MIRHSTPQVLTINRVAAVMIAVLCAGCTGDVPRPARNGDAGTPRLSLADSVVLQETDSLYLGSPGALTVTPTRLFVSDGQSERVVSFSPEGRVVSVYGKKGKGPGELTNPGPVAVIGDSVLVVTDRSTRTLSTFDLRSGRFGRSVRFMGNPLSLVPSGDTVWFGAIRMGAGTSTAFWALAADSVEYAGPRPPAAYFESPQLAAIHTFAPIERWSDTILVGYTGHHALYVADGSGALRDSLVPPAVHRRGVPVDLGARFARGGLTPEQEASMSSVLAGVHHTPSGAILLVHLDYVIRGTAPTATGYVSVLSPDLRRACVDARLDLSQDARPVIGFLGDTIYTLEQHVAVENRASTVVRKYTIDSDGCSWRPADASANAGGSR